MCESNVYLTTPNTLEEDAELYLEAVDLVLPEGEDCWRLISIFGEQKIINGRIKSMSLVNHRILFERV